MDNDITFLSDAEMAERYPPPTGIGKSKNQIAIEAVVDVFDALAAMSAQPAGVALLESASKDEITTFPEALATLKMIVFGNGGGKQ